MSDTQQQDIAPETAEPGKEVHAASELPGKRLRECRESKHLSRDEVAHHLRLDVQLIVALEEDQFSRLPSPAYICGYLRSYARLLKLPEDEIVQAYNQGEQINAELIPSSVNMQPAKPPMNTALLKTIVFVIIAVLLVGGAYYLIDKYDIFSRKPSSKQIVKIKQHDELSVPLAPESKTEKSTAPVTAASSKSVATAPAEKVEQKTEPAAASAKQATGTTKIEKLPTPKTRIPASEPVASSGQAEATANTSASAAATSTAVAPSNNADATTAVLRMHFTDNSWVEVTDSTNKRLVYRLVEKDSDLNLTGVPPFTILLGNAAAVQVFYKGKEFDHTNYRRDQVANFKVGAN